MTPVKPSWNNNVPRGTSRYIWRAQFSQDDRLAIAARQKSVFREPISPSTCVFTRGQFSQLDTQAGKPEVTEPLTMELAGRLIMGSGERRSVRVTSKARPGDLIFIGGRTARIEDASESLIVQSIRLTRLQSISDLDAAFEGVAAFPSHDPETPYGEDVTARAYQAAIALLQPMALKRWSRTEAHVRACEGQPTLRAAFAVRWIAQHDYSWWNENPWTWVYDFELSTARPLDLLKTLEQDSGS